MGIWFTYGRRGTCTGLAEKRLPLVRSEPGGNRCECSRDVVHHAVDVIARVIDIKVFVQVEDQISSRFVWVHDRGERWSPSSVTSGSGNKSTRAGEVRSWQEDYVRDCLCFPDCCYCGLDADNPGWQIEIVRLVRQSEDDELVVGVFCCKLCPQVCELCICWSSLAYNLCVPTRKVVDVDYTVRACLEAGLHEEIVVGQVFCVEWADNVVGEILPRNGCMQSDKVEPR